MGERSPPLIVKAWLERRGSIAPPSSKHLFVTVAGRNKGGRVSTDSLRKHVAAAFGHGAASHSLRKGGAQFYSRRGLDQDATRQQGGWKTAEVMASVYTTLAPHEVKQQILQAGASTSCMHESHLRVQKLAATPELAAAGDIKLAWAVLNLVKGNLHALSTRVLFEAHTPKYLKALIKHADGGVSATAVRLYTTIHAGWMAQQAAKMRKKE